MNEGRPGGRSVGGNVNAAVAQKIHLSQLFKFPQPPLSTPLRRTVSLE